MIEKEEIVIYENGQYFYDDYGLPVDEIFDYLTPNEVYLFLVFGTSFFPRPNGVDIRIVSVDDLEDLYRVRNTFNPLNNYF